MTSVTIPKSVNVIGENAFHECLRLGEIHCKSTIPPRIAKYQFEKIKDICNLYVPKGFSAAYKNIEGWKDFANIIEE